MPTPTPVAEGPVGTDVGITCLVELVLSAGEFGPQTEPALRELRAALEVDHPSPTGPVLRTGMAVTQEFGKLDITLRALVASPDLVAGVALGAQRLRQAVALLATAGPGGAVFQEQSVRGSWT